MLQRALPTTPLAGAVLTLDLEMPQHHKVLQLKLLKYCNGVIDRVLGLCLFCTCKLFWNS